MSFVNYEVQGAVAPGSPGGPGNKNHRPGGPGRRVFFKIAAGAALPPRERIKVGNMLPAMFLPIAYLPLAQWLAGLLWPWPPRRTAGRRSQTPR